MGLLDYLIVFVLFWLIGTPLWFLRNRIWHKGFETGLFDGWVLRESGEGWIPGSLAKRLEETRYPLPSEERFTRWLTTMEAQGRVERQVNPKGRLVGLRVRKEAGNG